MRALITGASRGIGRALSRTFAGAGFDLYLAARDPARLAVVREEVAGAGAEVMVFAGDLSRRQTVDELALAVLERWGGVDVLINNAGLYAADTILAADEDSLESMMAINLYCPYRLCRALAPAMARRGSGHIFNLCSVASRQGYSDAGLYTITKHALLGLSRALREELRPGGVRVTAVIPGPTNTSSWKDEGISDDELMRPEDVAAAILSAWQLSPGATVEEIVLQPQFGKRR